jgi:hypothetical protein
LYCGWDPASRDVLINGLEFPVTHEGHINCYLNNDASHSLIDDDGDWLLDGKPVQFPELSADGRIWDVEMTNDIWYVYLLVK